MIQFTKEEIAKATKTIQASIKASKGLPKEIKIKDTTGKTRTLDKPHYAGLFENRNIYIHKHRKAPSKVTLNQTANNPLVLNHQDSSVTCGPTSLSMAIQVLYGYKGEEKCKIACKTGSSGTSPDNLIAGAKSLGYKVTPIGRNYKSVKASIDKGKPVIAHIETGGNTKPACLGYLNNYGHYILIHRATGEKYYIADPTKGLKTCSPGQIDKATNGRNIRYYSVGIL